MDKFRPNLIAILNHHRPTNITNSPLSQLTRVIITNLCLPSLRHKFVINEIRYLYLYIYIYLYIHIDFLSLCIINNVLYYNCAKLFSTLVDLTSNS